MKKILALILIAVFAFSLVSCGKKDSKTITVGATPVPHAEILEVCKEILAKEGITLVIKEFDDYVIPNTSTEDGSLDANYFQHVPYLDSFNAERGTHLVSVCAVHYEPLGLYPGKSKSLSSIPDGATIAVPNDTSNEARALLLLEYNGIIKLDPNAGMNATVLDITENPHNVEIVEMEAAQLTAHLPDVDYAVINGNSAINAGLNAAKDALVLETSDSIAAVTYANVLVVKKGNENNELVQALVKALTSDEVKKFIEEKYEGSVVSMVG